MSYRILLFVAYWTQWNVENDHCKLLTIAALWDVVTARQHKNHLLKYNKEVQCFDKFNKLLIIFLDSWFMEKPENGNSEGQRR